MNNRYTSITIELGRLILIAMVLAVALFAAANMAGRYIIAQRFECREYIEKKNLEQVKDLRSFVRENHVSVTDRTELSEWMKKHPLLSIQIFKSGILEYDSDYPDMQGAWSVEEQDYYGWEEYYRVEFADGEADVFLYGYYAYQFYVWALLAEIFLAFLLFIMIVLTGIRKTARYIHRLSSEIGILEGGDLTYEITVLGRDELTELAEGLNAMRISLKNQMEQASQVMKSNQKMVTEMSHDLRTPLTSLLICTEILKKKKYKEEKKLDEYVEKIDRKAKQIKTLSDHIFEYALVGAEAEVSLEPPAGFQAVFYDVLSEASMYLEARGFRTERVLERTEDQVQVNTGYVNRIFDNLLSNILKYADKAAPVLIRSRSSERYIEISFENWISREKKKVESTNIGLHNVKNMMSSMGGYCRAKEEQGRFRVSLYFPRSREAVRL